MRFRELKVDGFGKLAGRAVVFDPGMNVVYGPNEAGKSTMSAAILATLFGFERGDKDGWRPWSGARYGTALTYELAGGRIFEVQRDFERDGKGIRVYDEHGNDASGECAVGKTVNPGHAHLGIPLEVFVNASFVAQGDVAIDGARAERITHALARALDGGPREDAALGAIKRLDDALSTYVGKKRATVNAPLKHLQDDVAEAEERANEMRARLRALDDLRARLQEETLRSGELEGTLREHERRARALRAFTLRSRLDSLSEIRDDIAHLAEQRSTFADVESFPSYLVAALDEHYRDFIGFDASAHAQADESARYRFTPAQIAELEERRGDGGAVDDDAFAGIESDAADATEARNDATIAADRAQAARRSIDGGGDVFGAVVIAASLVTIAAVVLAIVHLWPYAIAGGALALVLFGVAWSRGAKRRNAFRTVDAAQRSSDAAMTREREAAARVAAALEPSGAPTVDELRRRRERYRELIERKTESLRLAETARATRASADQAAELFDDLAAKLVQPSTPPAPRLRTLAEAKAQEARKSARDGIDLRLSMLDVRRSDVVGTDDEFALETELNDLLAEGVEPAAPNGASLRAFELERADLERRATEWRSAQIATAAELGAAEGQIGDLPALDERVAHLREHIARLERFEAAITLARSTIEERTREAHQKFARRLANYASVTFANVTGERYIDIRIDPTTLAVRVRVPESGEIVDVDRLSAGTREQAYLVVRLAMARMFAEGLETAPLLLDDPFAYWDRTRIERGFPILEAAATDAQIVLFTTSELFATEAAKRGAKLIDLTVASATASNGSIEPKAPLFTETAPVAS